jgi:hypothetical protein
MISVHPQVHPLTCTQELCWLLMREECPNHDVISIECTCDNIDAVLIFKEDRAPHPVIIHSYIIALSRIQLIFVHDG